MADRSAEKVDEGLLRSAFARAHAEMEGLRRAGRNLKAGGKQLGAVVDLTTANTFMLLDRGARILEKTTGLSRGGAFARLESFYRNEAEQLAKEAIALGDEDLGAQIYQILGGLPGHLVMAGGAMAVGGPVAGFGALGALQEAHRGPEAAALGGAKGAGIGALFPATRALGPVARSVTIGGTTEVAEKAGGAPRREAMLTGATLGILAGATAKRPVPVVKPEKIKLRRPVGEKQQTIEVEKVPPIVEVTPRTERVAREFLGRDYSDLELPDKAINLNLRRIQGPEDFKKATAQLVEILEPEIQGARRGRIALEQTERMAEDLGMTVEQLLARRKGQAFNDAEITAARILNRSVLEEWSKSSKQIKTGRATDQDKFEFARLTALVDATLQSTLGATAEAGRALSAHRIQAGPRSSEMRQIREMIREFKGKDGKELETFADMVSQIDSPQGLAKFAAGMRKATTGEKFIELWINSLLSGLPTHVVNLTSNQLVSLYTIPETYLAGAISKVETGLRRVAGRPKQEQVRFREGTARLFGYVEGFREGLVAAGKTFWTGEPSDPLTKIETLRHRAISGKKGDIIRIPGRALIAADELNKAIGRRQELQALGMRTGLEEGLRGRTLARHVHEFTRDPPDWAQERALLAGRYQTFTSRLGKSGRGLQEFTHNVPGRVVIPFVRTPTNIFKFALERTPAGLAMKEVRNAISKGTTAERSTALSRLALSTGIMAWVVHEAAGGNITGAGPSDPELRAAWFASGRQPYSIRVPASIADRIERRTGVKFASHEGATGDAWVSFARLEPIGTLLGVAADYAEISGHVEREGSEKLAAQIAIAANRNISSKTWLQGMTQVALALSDPDRYGERFVQKLTGTVVPTIVAQIERSQDPVLREVHGSIDQIKSRIPGFSKTLPPRRNIWGEPILLSGGLGPDLISPFYSNRETPDVTTQEVVRLRAELAFPDRHIGKIELTPAEYSRLVEISGKLAKREIDRFVNSPSYGLLPSDQMRKEGIEELYRAARAIGRDILEEEIIVRDPQRFVEPERESLENLLGIKR
jgi:hypothetical protein